MQVDGLIQTQIIVNIPSVTHKLPMGIFSQVIKEEFVFELAPKLPVAATELR